MPAESWILWIALLPFLAAVPAPWLSRRLGSRTGWLLALAPVAGAVMAFRTLPISPGTTRVFRVPWVPDLGVELAFLADGLSITFVLLVTVIGALVLIYAGGYLGKDQRLGRFYAFLLVFMGAMLGLVLADNVFTLFVFWELTSISSYALIGFDHHTEAGRNAAYKALLITGGGGLALLVGLILLSIAGAEFGLDGLAAARLSELATVDIRGHGLYPLILVTLLIGCFTKSAQFPFHFWLPAAMAGPTPVSAFLHSATMVKAGVYLLARLHPMLGGTDLWHFLVTPFGLVTMLLAAVMAVAQRDLKRVLAFSTLAVLGTLVMLLGIGTEMAIKTAVVYLVAHALYKAALFMVAGNVDHETGTRDLPGLGGLRRVLPWTAAAGLLAAASKAGAPPMFGFIGKELLYTTKLDLEHVGAWLIVAAVVANVALVASALMVSVWPFLGRLKPTPKQAHEAPLEMLVGPLLLALLGLGRGLQPQPFETGLGSAAASAIAGHPVTMHLALWHGVDPKALAVMALSLLTLALGFLVYRSARERLAFLARLGERACSLGPERLFEKKLDLVQRGAASLTGWLQNGLLRRYLLITIVVTIGVVGWPLLSGSTMGTASLAGSPQVHELLLVGLLMAGAALAASLRSRLAAVASLGVSGFAMAILFVLFGAPDLALTQIVVETLSVIVLVLVFLRLPPVERRSSAAQRLRDLAVAAAVGLMTATLVVGASGVAAERPVSEYFLAQSQPAAHGRNVVNVILVDFRAMDTLGEITVLATAGIGVLALLRLGRRRTRG